MNTDHNIGTDEVWKFASSESLHNRGMLAVDNTVRVVHVIDTPFPEGFVNRDPGRLATYSQSHLNTTNWDALISRSAILRTNTSLGGRTPQSVLETLQNSHQMTWRYG